MKENPPTIGGNKQVNAGALSKCLSTEMWYHNDTEITT